MKDIEREFERQRQEAMDNFMDDQLNRWETSVQQVRDNLQRIDNNDKRRQEALRILRKLENKYIAKENKKRLFDNLNLMYDKNILESIYFDKIIKYFGIPYQEGVISAKKALKEYENSVKEFGESDKLRDFWFEIFYLIEEGIPFDDDNFDYIKTIVKNEIGLSFFDRDKEMETMEGFLRRSYSALTEPPYWGTQFYVDFNERRVQERIEYLQHTIFFPEDEEGYRGPIPNYLKGITFDILSNFVTEEISENENKTTSTIDDIDDDLDSEVDNKGKEIEETRIKEGEPNSEIDIKEGERDKAKGNDEEVDPINNYDKEEKRGKHSFTSKEKNREVLDSQIKKIKNIEDEKTQGYRKEEIRENQILTTEEKKKNFKIIIGSISVLFLICLISLVILFSIDDNDSKSHAEDTESIQTSNLYDEIEKLQTDLNNKIETTLPNKEEVPVPIVSSANETIIDRILPINGSINQFNWLSEKELAAQDLSNYSKSDLRLLRNAIYALHGYKFQSSDLKEYFGNFSGYVPKTSNIPDFNAIEQANINLIKSME